MLPFKTKGWGAGLQRLKLRQKNITKTPATTSQGALQKWRF
jgi:predicted Zn-dependent protease